MGRLQTDVGSKDSRAAVQSINCFTNPSARLRLVYENNYRKERLGISVSGEELKKGIEEDGADGYTKTKYWKETWLINTVELL